MTSTTYETVAQATSIREANEWLASTLRNTERIGGLYPIQWADAYHVAFRQGLDAGGLLLSETHLGERLITSLMGAITDTDTLRAVPDEYRVSLGEWLTEHYIEYLRRAFPLGSRWAISEDGACFAGFTTDMTLERVTGERQDGVGVMGRCYFQQVGVDDTVTGPTQFLYPAFIRPLVPTTVGYPTPPDGFTNFHADAVNAAQVWVNDGVRDVATGVDAQMVAWSEWWPNDTCGADAAAKDYASALMEQKCRTLGIPFPVQPAPVERSLVWGEATRLTPGETYPAMTVLLMAANPRTAGGGGVYFGNTEPVLVHLTYGHTVSEDGRTSSPTVRRVDGQVTTSGMMTQVVGEQYLRIPATPTEPTPEPTPEPEAEWTPPTEAEWRRMNRDLTALRDFQTKAFADADTISEVYNDEADRRNWCSEADEVTEKINRLLQVLTLTRRESEHEVVISGWIRVPFSYSMTVTAADSDSAYEQAEESWSEYVDAGDLVRDYVDRYMAEIDGDVDVEVQ